MIKVAFSPSSQWVASACQNNTIKLWDTGSGKEVFSTRVDAEVQQMKFSSNSKHLVVLTGTNFTRVLLYRVHKGTGWSNSCENEKILRALENFHFSTSSYIFFLGWFSQGLHYIYVLHPKNSVYSKLRVWLLKWYTCTANLSCKQRDFLQWQVDNLFQLLDGSTSDTSAISAKGGYPGYESMQIRYLKSEGDE